MFQIEILLLNLANEKFDDNFAYKKNIFCEKSNRSYYLFHLLIRYMYTLFVFYIVYLFYQFI